VIETQNLKIFKKLNKLTICLLEPQNTDYNQWLNYWSICMFLALQDNFLIRMYIYSNQSLQLWCTVPSITVLVKAVEGALS